MLVKSTLASIAVFFFCIHILFTYDYLGVVGGTLFPALFIMVSVIYVSIKHERLILFGLRKTRILMTVAFMVALVSTLIYSIMYKLDYSISDLTKAIIVVLIFYSPLFIYQDMGSVGKGFVRTAFVFNVIIFVFCYLFPEQIYSLPFISDQYGIDVADQRPRAWTQESSHFAALLLLLFACYRAVNNNKKEAMLFSAIMLAVIYYNGSKFAYIAMSVYFLLDVRLNYIFKYLILALLPFMFLIVAYDAVSLDIERFNSTSTRVNALIDGLKLMSSNPFGIGILNWESHFSNIINDIYRFFPINNEYEQMVKTGSNLSTKSVWIDSLLYLGWLFGVIMIFLMRRIKHNKHLNNRTATLTTIFLVGSVTSGIYTFFVMLALVFLAGYGGSNENTTPRKI